MERHKVEAAMGAAAEIVKRGSDALGNAQAQSIVGSAHKSLTHPHFGRTAATATGAVMTGIGAVAPAAAAVATVAAPIALIGLIGYGLYRLMED